MPLSSGDLEAYAADLHSVLGHPIRARALELCFREPASPAEVARALGEPLGAVAYHLRVLNEGGWVSLAYTRPARGAIEHFYEASGKANTEVFLLDQQGWQELSSHLDEFFTQLHRAQGRAARRASRRTRVGRDAPAPFAVSVVTLLHHPQPRTQSERPAAE